jgi:hypothetical protein
MSSILIGEVIETSRLSYNENTKNEYGNIMPLGTVRFKFVNQNYKGNSQFEYARPLTLNVGMIPMNGEQVFILRGPSIETKDNQNTASNYFYLPFPINSTDDVVINQIPDISFSTTVNSGISKPKKPLKLGETFPLPARPISPLQPYEGDFIIQNRSGASIRLGSGTKDNRQYSKKPEHHKDTNSGDPFFSFTLERPGSPKARPSAEKSTIPSGQNKHQSDKLKSQSYRVENISNNLTGIFGGITQKFRKVSLGRSRYFETKSIPNYNKPQILLDTDRIILNAKKDRLFLIAKERIILESRKIQLVTDEHSVDWDDLVNRVQDLARELHRLTSAQAFYSTVFGPTGPATNLAQVLRIHMLCQRWHLVPPSGIQRAADPKNNIYDFGINSVIPNITNKYLRKASSLGASPNNLRKSTLDLLKLLLNVNLNVNFNPNLYSGGVGKPNSQSPNIPNQVSNVQNTPTEVKGEGLPKSSGAGGLCGPDGIPIKTPGSGLTSITGSDNIYKQPVYPQEPVDEKIDEPIILIPKEPCSGILYEFDAQRFDNLTGVTKPIKVTLIALTGKDTDCKGWYVVDISEIPSTDVTEEEVNYFIQDDSLLAEDILADTECLTRELSKKVCKDDTVLFDGKITKLNKVVQITKQ